MPSLPAFTVIIPVHNGAAYLAETLDHALAQQYPAAEILVIDDGSRDASLEIVRHYGQRLRLFGQQNSSVSATRNFGASLATTEWIHFLDHDDVWEPDHLAQQAEAIRKNPAADVCYTGRCHLLEDLADGTFRRTGPLPVPGPDRLADVLVDRCPFPPSAVALRRSTFLAVGGFDGRHNSVEDWDLWLRLLAHDAHFIQAPKPTLLYRVHQAANTNNPLPVLKRSVVMVEQNILPQLSLLRRITQGPRTVSRLEAEAAVLLRQNGQQGALTLMLRSIARHPLHAPRRYKIAAHMLLHGGRLRAPSA